MEQVMIKAPEHTQQLIACSMGDEMLRGAVVSVLFYYKRQVAKDVLCDSMQHVLSDFPIFAGRLTNKGNHLHINCNNQGVMVITRTVDKTIDQALFGASRPENKGAVKLINPRKCIRKQDPLLTIKISYYACGGMAIGICWHHSIGDMATFMCFMRAWSDRANGKEYKAPLIVEDRREWMIKNVLDKDTNKNALPSVKYYGLFDLIKFIGYMILKARKSVPIKFYFSDAELKNMKSAMSDKSGMQLSVNDVLCAHIYSSITQLDTFVQERALYVAVNMRPRLGLPEHIAGNMVPSLHLDFNNAPDPIEIAMDLRKKLNNYEAHLNMQATIKYIKENGDNLKRYLPRAFDPVNRKMLMSNWSKYGVYDISFSGRKPFYFTPAADLQLPWLSTIIEGFDNKGRIFTCCFPEKLANELVSTNGLEMMHQYRDKDEELSDYLKKSYASDLLY